MNDLKRYSFLKKGNSYHHLLTLKFFQTCIIFLWKTNKDNFQNVEYHTVLGTLGTTIVVFSLAIEVNSAPELFG